MLYTVEIRYPRKWDRVGLGPDLGELIEFVTSRFPGKVWRIKDESGTIVRTSAHEAGLAAIKQ
jgi:hypothetical protein